MDIQLQDRPTTAALIAEQNDQFRKTWGAKFTVSGRIVTTLGVSHLDDLAQAAVMEAVMRFNTFDEENDPHGEHDFGAFEIESDGEAVLLFWKIDLYDTSYTFGSPEPSNPKVTRRVLTIMLTSEY